MPSGLCAVPGTSHFGIRSSKVLESETRSISGKPSFHTGWEIVTAVHSELLQKRCVRRSPTQVTVTADQCRKCPIQHG
ncbi:hypothetical protein BDM02DRAFT_3112727 [Thelephora ganbajun]|uniref:Uncharacterized protein n=1 Tax=Thelephora ganbajun TaxID=370292 RepID=A0ACB6ZK88_THEGA|nr:hypothetical protein BDM02DRAFT_3112727 [Thelephora ganbajun]